MIDDSQKRMLVEKYMCSRCSQNMKGVLTLSNNLIELLNIIINNKNPEQAVLTVAETISDYLKQPEPHQEEILVFQSVGSQMSSLHL